MPSASLSQYGVNFNPRSPRGGATDSDLISVADALFQSTLPTRGSDFLLRARANGCLYFNPRSPRGGATYTFLSWYCQCVYFNPRSPRGGATGDCRKPSSRKRGISIHAPHEGERQAIRPLFARARRFQSTLPTRGSDSGKVHLYTAFPRIC